MASEATKRAIKKWREENKEHWNALKREGARRRRAAKQLVEAGRPKPGNCEICNSGDPLVFDHCHTKGHFRGWICHRCNRVLGQYKDRVGILMNMVEYLRARG